MSHPHTEKYGSAEVWKEVNAKYGGSMIGIECPWPESVWPMTDNEYVEAVPDPQLWTSISGFLMRRGWQVAVRQIKETQNSEVSGAGATASNEQPKSATRQRSLD